MAFLLRRVEACVHDNFKGLLPNANEKYWKAYRSIERAATGDSFHRLFKDSNKEALFRDLEPSLRLVQKSYTSDSIIMTLDVVRGMVKREFVDRIID